MLQSSPVKPDLHTTNLVVEVIFMVVLPLNDLEQ